MTTEEERNLAVAKQYEVLYNTDVERLVRECYAPDYEARAMGSGMFRGHDKFVEVEQQVLRAAPKRHMRVDQTHTNGPVVTVEAVLLDPAQGPDWQLPFCAVLVCREGQIVLDRTYADFRQWPGFTLD